MGKENVVHIYVCVCVGVSAVKTDSIFPGKWVKLEIIVLSKISYTQANAIFSSYVEHKVERHT